MGDSLRRKEGIVVGVDQEGGHPDSLPETGPSWTFGSTRALVNPWRGAVDRSSNSRIVREPYTASRSRSGLSSGSLARTFLLRDWRK
jgi:hypothetical protein